MNNTILIGVFSQSERAPRKLIVEILETFSARQVFVFKIKNAGFVLTFNIAEGERAAMEEFKRKFSSALHLHRNKGSNTLYTINSLNEVIKNQNNGLRDLNFRVDWSVYKNSLLVLDKENKLQVLSTELYDVVELP